MTSFTHHLLLASFSIMDISKDISKILSKVIGIYFIIVSTAMLVDMHQFIGYVNELVNNAPLMFVTGFFTIIIGILMVVSHNIWRWNWRIIITFIGWLTLLKGVSIIYYPKFIDKTTALLMQNTTIGYSAASINFALGLLLCFLGWHHSTHTHK